MSENMSQKTKRVELPKEIREACEVAGAKLEDGMDYGGDAISFVWGAEWLWAWIFEQAKKYSNGDVAKDSENGYRNTIIATSVWMIKLAECLTAFEAENAELRERYSALKSIDDKLLRERNP